MIHQMFDDLVRAATTLLPTLGQALAFGGKVYPSYSTGRMNRRTGQALDPRCCPRRQDLPRRPRGRPPWQKVMRWFGYPLHLVVDSHHGLPVAYEVLKADASEVTRLLPMVVGLKEKRPEALARTERFTTDRGLDSAEVNRSLLQFVPGGTVSVALHPAPPPCRIGTAQVPRPGPEVVFHFIPWYKGVGGNGENARIR